MAGRPGLIAYVSASEGSAGGDGSEWDPVVTGAQAATLLWPTGAPVDIVDYETQRTIVYLDDVPLDLVTIPTGIVVVIACGLGNIRITHLTLSADQFGSPFFPQLAVIGSAPSQPTFFQTAMPAFRLTTDVASDAFPNWIASNCDVRVEDASALAVSPVLHAVDCVVHDNPASPSEFMAVQAFRCTVNIEATAIVYADYCQILNAFAAGVPSCFVHLRNCEVDATATVSNVAVGFADIDSATIRANAIFTLSPPQANITGTDAALTFSFGDTTSTGALAEQRFLTPGRGADTQVLAALIPSPTAAENSRLCLLAVRCLTAGTGDYVFQVYRNGVAVIGTTVTLLAGATIATVNINPCSTPAWSPGDTVGVGQRLTVGAGAPADVTATVAFL